MQGRKINLEEILKKNLGYSADLLKNTSNSGGIDIWKGINDSMLEFGEQLLELAYKNINFIDDPNSYCGNTGSEYPPDQILDKKKFLNTINQIE